MEDSKFILASKTVIGLLMVVAAPLMNKFLGVQLDTALQAELSGLLEQLMIYGGATFAFYGRLKATKKLSV